MQNKPRVLPVVGGVPPRVWACRPFLWPLGCPGLPVHPCAAPGPSGQAFGGSDFTPARPGYTVLSRCLPLPLPVLALCWLLLPLQSRLLAPFTPTVPSAGSSHPYNPVCWLLSPLRCLLSDTVCMYLLTRGLSWLLSCGPETMRSSYAVWSSTSVCQKF